MKRSTLPIRRWMALALAVTFLVPAALTAMVAGHEFGAMWHSTGEAGQLLRAGVGTWGNPAWQASTRAKLKAQGIDFVLVENGREIYRSTPDPLAGTDANNQRSAQRLVIPGPGPRRIAYIYSDANRWSGAAGGFWLVPLVGLAALLATLAAIAWFVGRTLVVPLAATSRAALRIAEGELDVQIPASHVREVAQLRSSFTAMGAELRASLEHQAEIEEERRLFVSAIAHDLRTPLFSLRGHLEGLAQGLATTPEKAEQYIQVCREKADVLERLISDLFAYTRVQYLEQTLHADPQHLDVLLTGVADGRRREAEAKGVTLELSGPTDCVVAGDRHLLGRAVENLLDNALRHTPAGGSVRVRWLSDGQKCIFSVADTGPGIAPRDLPHLFEPLYRADASRSRQTGGAGLGLTIARRIFRAHGGDLIAANAISGGAAFTASMPLAISSATGDEQGAVSRDNEPAVMR